MPDNAEPMFGAAFNAAVIPLTWKQIQPGPDQWKWTIADKQMQQCLRQRFKIFGGPLLRFDPAFFPEWALDGPGGAERLTTLVRKFIQAVIGRYRGQVQLWHAVAGANLPGELPINEDQRVRLTVMAVETAKRADPRTPAIVSFDQPWAEYLSEQTGELPPLHLADSLVRAEVGLAGIGMELNLGYWPGGSLVRDELEIGQLIDNWSLLGLPLIPLLAIPSSDAERPGGLPPRAKLPGGASPDNQKRLIERILPGLLAKQSVQAIVWNQVFDSLPHKYPHGGLFRENGLPKPSLASLIAIRSQHLE
jgi:hypothetical protein